MGPKNYTRPQGPKGPEHPILRFWNFWPQKYVSVGSFGPRSRRYINHHAAGHRRPCETQNGKHTKGANKSIHNVREGGKEDPTDRYCGFGIFRGKNGSARARLTSFGPLPKVANQFVDPLRVFLILNLTGPYFTCRMVAYEQALPDPFLPRKILKPQY